MTRTIAIWLFTAVTLFHGDLTALEIRVTAEAKLEVKVSGAGTTAQVSGALRDDLSRGLPQRKVLVQIDARQTGQTVFSDRVHTDGLGRFGVHQELPPGDYEVFVRFDKTDHLDGIADSKSLRLDPAPVDVRAYAPAFVYRRTHPAWLSARASAADVPYQGWAEVFIAGKGVGRMEFDASGRGTFDVGPHLAEGINAIRLRTPGSAYRDEATAEVEVRFAERVLLEAHLDERLERLQRGLAVSGKVSDAIGPLGGVRVVGRIEALLLFDDDERKRAFTASAMTRPDGTFVAFVPGSKLADGVWIGSADFVPPLGERLSVDAGEVEIDSRAYRVAVNGFGWLVLLVGVLLLVARGGASFVDIYRRWREGREKKAREAAALEEVETIVPVYLEADPSIPADAERDDLGGVVFDVWQKRSVPGAKVVLYADEKVLMEVFSDEAGRFRFVDVERGRVRLEVRCHGFIRGNLELSIPHDGRLSNFRLDLVAVPLKIRRLVGAVLEQSVGEDLWGRLSPREIEARLESLWPDEEPADDDRRQMRALVASRLADHDIDGLAVLSALTEVVEESYFSGRRYGEEAFLFARALVVALRARRSAAGAERSP